MSSNEAGRILRACAVAREDVRRAVSAGEPADRALSAFFRAHRGYGARDRRRVASAIFAEFRWQGWLTPIEDLATRLAAALLLDGEADAARRLTTVEPVAPPAPPVALRGKAAWLSAWLQIPEPPLKALAPAWAFKEIGRGDEVQYERFLEAVQRRPPVWLRARRGRAEQVLDTLRKAGYPAVSDPRRPDAIRIDSPVSRSALAPLLHRYAEVQDIASQEIVRLCDPQPGEYWWDICAGAGGKTLQLLDLLQGKGFVFCTDVRAAPLKELARRARAAGFENWRSTRLGAGPRPLNSLFDGILVDAPCSGSGTWGRAPDARWRVSAEELARFAARQVKIVLDAAGSLRPGGRLIYAVCSLAKSECEDVAEAVVRESGLRLMWSRPIGPDWGPGIGMWCAAFLRE